MSRASGKHTISAAEIKAYTSTQQDDFLLEMEAIKACVTTGWDCKHGGTYQDPVTRKIRQFDARAIINHGSAFIRLAIECKSLKLHFPLLVSRTQRSLGESFHEIVISAPDRDPTGSWGSEHRFRGEQSIYSPNHFVGRSTTQVGKDEKGHWVDGDSEVFDKWSQAISSTYDLIADSVDAARQVKGGAVFSFILPVLVVGNKTLWVADYSADGELHGDPSQAEECEYFVGREVYTGPMGVGYSISHLHIVTVDGLWSLLSRFGGNPHSYSPIFSGHDPAQVRG